MKFLCWFCGLVVAACAIADGIPKSPPSPQDEAAVAYRVKVRQIQRSIRDILRDPSSAEFGPTFMGRNGAFCGTINSKNGFGGFTGFQVFTVRKGELRIGNASARTSWNAYCAGV